jgi:DNA-binding HxlR family transcriptional regulator
VPKPHIRSLGLELLDNLRFDSSHKSGPVDYLLRRVDRCKLFDMHREFGQFCPVALASEVLAERWTLLVVRELLAGARRFNDIRRGVPRLSATLLKQRLETLQHAGIVARHAAPDRSGPEYELTASGKELKPVVSSFGEWGQRWARDMRPQDLDPGWLIWSIHRRLNTESMPDGRTVIEVEFVDAPAKQRRFWLVHMKGKVDVCLKDPGYDTTVRLSTRVRTLAEVWRGIRSIKDELRAGSIQLDASADHRREFPQWLLLSVYAPIKRIDSKKGLGVSQSLRRIEDSG